MAREVKVPEISENIDEATVVAILVSEGDEVEEEQALIEIETDKAVSELPSPAAGKVKSIKVKEGDEIKVGSVVLTIEESDGEESPPSSETSADKKEEPDDEEEETEDKEKEDGKEESKVEEQETEDKKESPPTPEAAEDESTPSSETSEDKKEESAETMEDEDERDQEEEEKTSPPSSETSADNGRPVAASPSVRRFAREIGVKINEVEGTGPGNRILVDDVKAYAKEKLSGEAGPGMGGMAIELPDFSKWGETERKPLSKVRQITADNTWKSWNANPHVTQFDKADITELESFREKYSKTVEKAGGKLTVTAILLKIVAIGLQQFPRFNSSLDMQNKEIIFKKYINIGVAVDTDRGLLVPVVRNVDKKSITELALELGELAEKARNKKISPDELQGGNFVISNLGGIGGTNFTPVIFPPQVSIMGVARAETQPVYIDGEFKPRLILPLNVSYDHKIIDGADGARFLRWTCEALENPFSIFLKNNS